MTDKDQGRSCEHCGTSIEGRRKGTRFCSSSCRSDASERRAKRRDSQRKRRLLSPATAKGIERFWDGIRWSHKRSPRTRGWSARGIGGLAVLALVLVLAGCGSSPHKVFLRGTPGCTVAPGAGHMGVCAPKAPPASTQQAPLSRFGRPLRTGPVYRFVDVSSFQACQHWNFSAVIAKAYEFGFRQDSHVTCHLGLNRDKPTGVYFFARPGDANAQADLAASVARRLGPAATNSLPATLDYEVSAGGCSYIRAFGDRYMRDTGNRRFVVYSAQFIWPGCSLDSRFILWDAAYGPRFNILCCFADHSIFKWQYTDGRFGPQPHFGSNLDVDVYVSGSPQQEVASNGGPPPPPPIPAEVQRLKDQIVTLWDRRGSGHLNPADRKTYDADMNRIYFLGWQPHRSQPSHDWKFKPGQTELAKCAIVVRKWKQGKRGHYVQRLLHENWQASHTRCHTYGTVRMPGTYRIAG